jgi:large subunit ribosomal protein L10
LPIDKPQDQDTIANPFLRSLPVFDQIRKGGDVNKMRLEQKQQIAEDLRGRFSKSAIIVVADYKGLDVAAINDLRRKLRKEDVEFQVAKNTLLLRAAKDTDAAVIQDFFKGPSAVALSYNDPVAPAKILTQFAKDHNQLEIKAGVLNGKKLELDAIKALAKLPSREVMLGQLLSAFNEVPTSFVRTLAGIPRGLLNVLTAIKEQKETA